MYIYIDTYEHRYIHVFFFQRITGRSDNICWVRLVLHRCSKSSRQRLYWGSNIRKILRNRLLMLLEKAIHIATTYIYIFLYICICIYMYVYIYTVYIYIYTYTYIYIYLYIHVYMYICSYKEPNLRG
jgi:hypothetical protein